MLQNAKLSRRMLAAVAALLLVGGAGANELAAPKGEVILSVTGKIARANAPGRADFDRDMLIALGMTTIRTSNSWSDGATAFEGVPVAKLLEVVGASGSKIRATAINNYAIDLDVEEMRRYPVLLAMKADGQELRRRDRGPLWVIYPRDSFPELREERHNYKWIWQLRTLEIQ